MRIVYVLLSPTFGMHQYTADLANRVTGRQWIAGRGTVRGQTCLVTTVGYPADRYSPEIQVHTPLQTRGTGLSAEGIRLGEAKRIARTIAGLRPDVVHFTGPHLWNVPIVRYLVRHGIPTIHTLHDLDPHRGMRFRALLHIWNALIIRSTDYILVHGDRYRARLLGRGRAGASVVCTPLMHLFLSYDQNLMLSDLDGDGNGAGLSYEPEILFFGRFEAYKGVDVLLTAYAELVSQAEAAGSRSAVPRLVLAGRGELSDLWAGTLPEGVIVRNGLIGDDEALALFRRCSLLVLPYVDATQSALIPAAYFFRKPVVVTRTGVLPEYVVDQQTGFVVEPNHPASLARALDTAMGDRERLREMGGAGRAWYDRHRGQETDALLRLYRRAASKRAPAPRLHPSATTT